MYPDQSIIDWDMEDACDSVADDDEEEEEGEGGEEGGEVLRWNAVILV